MDAVSGCRCWKITSALRRPASEGKAENPSGPTFDRRFQPTAGGVKAGLHSEGKRILRLFNPDFEAEIFCCRSAAPSYPYQLSWYPDAFGHARQSGTNRIRRVIGSRISNAFAMHFKQFFIKPLN
jgi:hypothetical protein